MGSRDIFLIYAVLTIESKKQQRNVNPRRQIAIKIVWCEIRTHPTDINYMRLKRLRPLGHPEMNNSVVINVYN